MDRKRIQWIKKQYRGLDGYKEEIENKNYVFDSISKDFGAFCNLNGRILDIGCGIRSALPYAICFEGSNFVGIDPFIEYKRDFEFVGGVGEHLPFKKNSFDHVIFATSLDHVVNPKIVLVEANRILKDGGKINIWISCFDWIERLQQGERIKAMTLFFWNLDFRIRKKDNYHFSHFTTPKIMSILRATGFTVTKMERMLYDPSTALSVFFLAEKRDEKNE